MAKLTRHRHGKHYTQKELAEGDVQTGASAPADSPLWTSFSVRLSNAKKDDGSTYVVELSRAEAARVVGQLADFLARDTRKPMLVNGSKGHA